MRNCKVTHPPMSRGKSDQFLPLDNDVICCYTKRHMAHISAVVQELGGDPTFGRVLANDHDMRDAIREGFPPAVIERLMQASGLTLKELAASLDLSPRSLQRRPSGGRLAPFESDRLYRLARLLALAPEAPGSPHPPGHSPP